MIHKNITPKILNQFLNNKNNEFNKTNNNDNSKIIEFIDKITQVYSTYYNTYTQPTFEKIKEQIIDELNINNDKYSYERDAKENIVKKLFELENFNEEKYKNLKKESLKNSLNEINEKFISTIYNQAIALENSAKEEEKKDLEDRKKTILATKPKTEEFIEKIVSIIFEY